MNLNFTKTIRFKLTLWYSALFIFLGLALIGIINVIVTSYYNQDPLQDGITYFMNQPRNPAVIQRLLELNSIQQEALRDLRQQDLHQIRIISLLSFVPLLFLSIVGGYIISGEMLKPIQSLNRATKQITAQDLSTQIDHPGVDDEIGELIANFNSMISRLEESFVLQKQFVENASHELKTPLAVTRTNIESLKMSAEKLADEDREVIETALKSTDFMAKLIDDLLLLSLLEGQIELKPIELVPLVKDAISQLQTLAKDQHIKIMEKNLPGEKLQVAANSVLLQRSIMNVIENAIRYAGTDSQITIAVDNKKQRVAVTVTDNGKGIAAEHLPKLFDRFYRVDKSRSRGNGGTGLGLSIVKRVVEDVHHGKVSITSEEGKGTSVEIELPLLNS